MKLIVRFVQKQRMKEEITVERDVQEETSEGDAREATSERTDIDQNPVNLLEAEEDSESMLENMRLRQALRRSLRQADVSKVRVTKSRFSEVVHLAGCHAERKITERNKLRMEVCKICQGILKDQFACSLCEEVNVRSARGYG